MKKNNNINNSIVSKISFKVLIETLSSYILIDIILIAMVCGGLYFDAQKDAKIFAKQYTISNVAKDENLIQDLGYNSLSSPNKIFKITSSYEEGFTSWLDSISYNYLIKQEGSNYIYLRKNMKNEMRFFAKSLGALLIIQGLCAISSLGKNRKIIRETMRPLDELAKATVVINKATDMSPESLKKIAGALDSINAAHLETRIPVESAKNELKSLTMAINGMLDRLDKAYQSQARFVSDASHELRTPIAVIQSYANLLDRWGMSEPETAEEAVKAIKSESEAMKTMVEQLLFLARGDNDSMHFQLTDIDLGILAEQTLSEIKMIDKNHKFSFEKQEETIIQGDIGLIKQLMRILIDNSIKYTPIQGNIHIKVYKDGENNIFGIQDEGQGISGEELENIFDRFYRTDKSRNRNTGGSGLGLSIGRWIVEKHNGNISVLSRENLGTRINIEIPAVKKSETQAKINLS